MNCLKKIKFLKEQHEELTPVGSRPGILYSLCKVYETLVRGLPKVRPILSVIGTGSYNVAKFLIPILAPNVNGPFSIINSFNFNKEILDEDAQYLWVH